MKNIHHQPESGVAAIITVVVLGAFALLAASAASILGLGELELGYTFQRGEEAFASTDGCVEETLRRIRLNQLYGVGAGTINLTVVNGTCAITVTIPVLGQREIIVIGESGEYNKKIGVTITLTGDVIALNSWIEKND